MRMFADEAAKMGISKATLYRMEKRMKNSDIFQQPAVK